MAALRPCRPRRRSLARRRHTHQLTKTDKAGNPLLTLGSGDPAPPQSGDPFNKPTDLAISSANGDIFVSDGYGNSRIHRYVADGKHLLSWGEPGADHGQFSLPHNIAMVDDDHVIVCDRENHRVQQFTVEGEFVRAWHVHHAVAVVRGRGEDDHLYIAEQARPPCNAAFPTLATVSRSTRLRANWSPASAPPCRASHPINSFAPFDCDGFSRDVYVAEVSYVEGRQPHDPRARDGQPAQMAAPEWLAASHRFLAPRSLARASRDSMRPAREQGVAMADSNNGSARFTVVVQQPRRI